MTIKPLHLWTLLALLALVFGVLTAAYAVRPAVSVDVGSYYDSIALTDFHDREVDGSVPGTTWNWPPEQNRLTLPGRRSGEWLATISAADGQPDDALRGLALSVNGTRVDIPRTGWRFFVALIPPDIAAAPTLGLKLEPGLRQGPEPPAGLAGRVVLQPARTYRWTRDESAVHLPGLGGGPWQLTMAVITAHPDGSATRAHLLANTVLLAELPDTPRLRRVNLLVPPRAMSSGSLNLTIQANTFSSDDPRPLGVLVSEVRAVPLEAGGMPLLPPWSVLLCCAVLLLALYVCLVGMTGRNLVAVLATLAALVLTAWALVAHRFPTTVMLPGLALLAVWSLVLLAGLGPLLTLVFDALAFETPPSSPPDGGYPPNPRWQLSFVNTLLLIFFVGYWLKAGGMLFPYFVGIDIHWHMDRVRHILSGGLPLYYGTSSPLNESTMPLAEWGPDRPVIPYSPYYHIAMAGLVVLPWSLELSANMVSVLLECSRVVLIALVARASGLSHRTALLAALLYALLPINFLLHSWGNAPTTTGLWWAFAATVGILVMWPRLRRPVPFLILVGLFLGTLLFYTVAGAFLALFLGLFTLAVWWVRATSQGLRPMWLAALVALALATLVYYGQYVGPIMEQTIPYFVRSFTSRAEDIGKVGEPLGTYVVRHHRLWGYGLLVPLVLTTGWTLAYGSVRWRKGWGPGAPGPGAQGVALLWAAISAWMTVTLVFFLLGYKVSMIDKHFFASIPLVVIASAIVLDRLWERGWLMRMVIVGWYAYLGTSALHLWLGRIATVQQ
ncbi:MAG: hypothetical protein HC884_17420 [Chloroflexaceae bacterium]|nr:hypothetical protein [Chloroflexaceae bacterium]